ncbi:Sec-independent protein translocase subunit TatA/TatB [Muribaculum intestinale]|uniref:Sec-independent protein translocase subunit TatA/TatB n=2 Tax=Muribaculum intestinale TaxID=1796646 RepID=UPI003DAA3AA8
MILCMIGATEIILICAMILLIFGGKKLPELMKGMGKGVKSFKEGMNEPTEEEMNRRVEEEVQRRADEKMNAQSSQSESKGE